MLKLKRLALAAGMVGLLSATVMAGLTVGFSQIGSESGWRAAETSGTKQQAEAYGIDLKFADAPQQQENQIKAIRGFIADGVAAILVAPVVATGWDAVVGAARNGGIPVILLDRGVDASQDLYLTSFAPDQVHEGAVAGLLLVAPSRTSRAKWPRLKAPSRRMPTSPLSVARPASLPGRKARK